MCRVRDLLQVQFWKNENRFRASIINLSKPVLPVPALDWFVLIRDDSKSLDPDYQRPICRRMNYFELFWIEWKGDEPSNSVKLAFITWLSGVSIDVSFPLRLQKSFKEDWDIVLGVGGLEMGRQPIIGGGQVLVRFSEESEWSFSIGITVPASRFKPYSI